MANAFGYTEADLPALKQTMPFLQQNRRWADWSVPEQQAFINYFTQPYQVPQQQAPLSSFSAPSSTSGVNSMPTTQSGSTPADFTSVSSGGQYGSTGGSYGDGQAGLNPMQSYLESIPGYQFAKAEGINAIQKSAAARGTLLTGGTLRGITRFATGLADQTYGNQVQRFLSLADIGARTAIAPY
jgi:hypothetical protein